jgi:hypothetical protein
MQAECFVPPIETGPLSLSELLDRMFAIYRRYFLRLMGATLLPYLFLIPVGAIAGVGIFTAIRSGATGLLGIGTSVAAVFLFVAIYWVVACLSWIAVTAAVWEIQSARTDHTRVLPSGVAPTVEGSFGWIFVQHHRGSRVAFIDCSRRLFRSCTQFDRANHPG